MAAPLPANSIVQVTIQSRMNNQTLLNVLTYQTGSVASVSYATTLDDLLTQLKAAGSLIPAMGLCLNANCTITQLWAQPVYPDRLAPIFQSSGINGDQDSGYALPQNQALVIEKIGDPATRWGRGSFHLGGLDGQAISVGTINPAQDTLMRALADQLRTVMTGGVVSFFPCLWSPKVPTRITRWNRYKVQQTARVMRRRTVGVGI